jgi:hypothetical protein
MFDTTTQKITENHPTHAAYLRPILRAAAAFTLAVTLAGAAVAVEPTPSQGDSPFSPRGFKGSIGLGGLTPSDSQHLDDGDAGYFAIGYGIDPHMTIWLSALGSEHKQTGPNAPADRKSDVGGLELTLQYALRTQSRLQPYGRLGFGAYSVEDRKTHDALSGGGFRMGIGADYWFARHCAVGLELVARGAEYSRSRTGKNGDFDDLPENIGANAGGAIFSFTVQ